MASIRQSIRSSTASKRPTSAIADGQIALNTASGTPGMFFKDSAGNIIKTGPAHYGASAPNSSPAVGGSTGNSIGEAWLDSSLTPAGWKIWNGSAWVNATPLSSDTVQGLVELATNAETQAGADTARAVTSAGLQSKVSDSISTASSSGIASSSAVKTAYDLANAALPKSGGIITGNLEIGSTGSLTFEGSTADGFETTLAVVDPTLDRTITFPNITGTVVTTGDTGTVTSTMILDGTIVDADINASAEIAVSKLADGAARQLLQTDAAGTGVEWASNIDIPGTLDVTSAATFDSTVAVTGALTKSGNNVVTVGDTGTVTSTMILDGTILNADVNASAAIAGTKISPDFGSQNTTTTGTSTAASFIPTSSSVPTNGVYLPAANSVAISTSGTGRLFVDASGNVGIATSNPTSILQGTLSSSSTGFAISTSLPTIVLNDSNGTTGTSYWGQLDATTYFLNKTNGNLIFGTNDTERLRITSAGLVGVGTSSPGYTLDVSGTFRNTGIARIGTGSTTTLAYFGNPDTVGNKYITFARASALTDIVNIQGVDAGVDVANISLQALGGRVGVGTTSPEATFHISASSAGGYVGQIIDNTSATGYVQQIFRIGSSGANGQASINYVPGTFFAIGPTANDTTTPIVFRNNNATERLRITSAGLVGIGTSAPEAKLSVFGPVGTLNDGGGTLLLATDAAGTDVQGTLGAGVTFAQRWQAASGPTRMAGIYGVKGSGSGFFGGTLAFYTQPASGANMGERLRITAEGNVGIGTTAPGSPLEIQGSADATTLLTLNCSSGTANGSITNVLRSTCNNNNFWANLRYDGTAHIWNVNASEAARIDSSKRLLVGTSSSSANARAVFQGYAGVTTDQGIVHLQYGTSSVANNATLGSLRFTNTDGYIGAWIIGEADAAWTAGSSYPTRLVFSTTADGAASPTERMRIDSAGNTRFNSASLSATADPGVKITSSATIPEVRTVVNTTDGGITNYSYYNTNATYNGYRFYVKVDGGVANHSVNNVNLSDRNVKKDISPAADTWDCIKEWEIVNYRYKDQPNTTTLNLGVIAQQVAESCPEVITVFEEAKDDQPEKLGVKEQQMYWMAIKALQEAQARIEALEADVAQLKGA